MRCPRAGQFNLIEKYTQNIIIFTLIMSDFNILLTKCEHYVKTNAYIKVSTCWTSKPYGKIHAKYFF